MRKVDADKPTVADSLLSQPRVSTVPSAPAPTTIALLRALALLGPHLHEPATSGNAGALYALVCDTLRAQGLYVHITCLERSADAPTGATLAVPATESGGNPTPNRSGRDEAHAPMLRVVATSIDDAMRTDIETLIGRPVVGYTFPAVGPYAQVLEGAGPVVIDDVEAIAAPMVPHLRPEQRAMLAQGARADRAVLAPLISGGSARGVLSVWGPRDTLGAEDAPAVAALGAQVGIALENARLLADADEERLRWRAAMEGAPEFVATCDAQARPTYLNPASERLLGVDVGRVVPIEERPALYGTLLPDGSAPLPADALPLVRAVREGRMLHGIEVLHRNSSGGERLVLWDAAPMRAPDGGLVGAVAMGRDITEQRHLEREAAERASQLEATFDAMADAVVMCDREGRLLRANEAFRSLIGVHLDPHFDQLPMAERARLVDGSDLNGAPLSPEMWPLARVLAGEVLTDETATDFVVHTLDGREVVLSPSGAPVRDASGTVIGGVAIYRDVTGRRRMEAALRESEERFRTLADNIPQLTWMAHPDGHIFWYNRRWYEYTGTRPESQEGWGWQSVHDPAVLPRVMEQWTRSIATGEPFDMTFPLKGADGVFRPFLTRVMPVKDEQGQVVRWFGTNTDVTEQRAAEEALRMSELALQEANRRKDEFLGIASHELRTPLTSTKTNVQLIVRRLDRLLEVAELDAATVRAQLEPLRQLLGRSKDALDRLAGLVNDLLDVSRIQAGKLEMRKQRADLAVVVREAVEEETQAWPNREVHLDGRLGVATDHVWAQVDPDRVRQMVINYLSNALKYAPPEQPITVRLESDAGEARVSVRDEGPGLTQAQQTRVFERFYRVEGIEHQQGSGLGLGLGLYISRTIAERHGGHVGVDSVPGQGATFWFTLPLQTDDHWPSSEHDDDDVAIGTRDAALPQGTQHEQ